MSLKWQKWYKKEKKQTIQVNNSYELFCSTVSAGLVSSIFSWTSSGNWSSSTIPALWAYLSSCFRPLSLCFSSCLARFLSRLRPSLGNSTKPPIATAAKAAAK